MSSKTIFFLFCLACILCTNFINGSTSKCVNSKIKDEFPSSITFANLEAHLQWTPQKVPTNFIGNRTRYIVETNNYSRCRENERWKERNCSADPDLNGKSEKQCVVAFGDEKFSGWFRIKMLMIEQDNCVCEKCECYRYSYVMGEHEVDVESKFSSPLLTKNTVNDHSVSVTAKLPKLSILCKYPDTTFTFKLFQTDEVGDVKVSQNELVDSKMSSATLLKTLIKKLSHLVQKECADEFNEVFAAFDGLNPSTNYIVSATYTVASFKPEKQFHHPESEFKAIQILTHKSNFGVILAISFISAAVAVAASTVGIYSLVVIIRKWKKKIKDIPEFLKEESKRLNASGYDYGFSEETMYETTNVFTPSAKEFTYVKLQRGPCATSNKSINFYTSIPLVFSEHFSDQSQDSTSSVEYTTIVFSDQSQDSSSSLKYAAIEDLYQAK